MSPINVFPMIPAASKSLWFFAIIGLILLGVFFMMGWLAWSMQHATFTVSREGLHLRGDFYGRLIPLKLLKLDEAVVTNLNTDKDHQPKWRTMGTGLPGYSGGCATEPKHSSTSPTAHASCASRRPKATRSCLASPIRQP